MDRRPVIGAELLRAECASRLAWLPDADRLELSLVGQNLLHDHHPEYELSRVQREFRSCAACLGKAFNGGSESGPAGALLSWVHCWHDVPLALHACAAESARPSTRSRRFSSSISRSSWIGREQAFAVAQLPHSSNLRRRKRSHSVRSSTQLCVASKSIQGHPLSWSAQLSATSERGRILPVNPLHRRIPQSAELEPDRGRASIDRATLTVSATSINRRSTVP